MDTNAQRYPLSWPAGWNRTDRYKRRRARFQSRGGSLTVSMAIGRLSGELSRLGASGEILSTNVETRLDGLPRSGQAEPNDSGAAVYFKLKGKPRCLACDTWDRVADNIAAIAQHIDALRRIDRYGVGTMEQAFAGYAQLPSAAGSWFIVLEFSEPPKSWDVIEARYKSLARMHHPDAGGNTETMAKINAAYDTARSEFGK